MDVEGVGGVGEDGEEVGEDDGGGADEEEPLERGGGSHGGDGEDKGDGVEEEGAHRRAVRETRREILRVCELRVDRARA